MNDLEIIENHYRDDDINADVFTYEIEGHVYRYGVADSVKTPSLKSKKIFAEELKRKAIIDHKNRKTNERP